MTRPGKMAGVLALLAALLLGAPALAQKDKEKDSDTPPKKLEEKVKDLEDLVKSLKDQLAKQQREAKEEKERMTEIVRNLNRKIDRQEESSSRRSFSIDPERRTTTEYGSIRLDNRLDVTAFVTIDGRTIRVPAFETRTLRDVVAGPLTYTVSANTFPAATIKQTRVYANETKSVVISD